MAIRVVAANSGKDGRHVVDEIDVQRAPGLHDGDAFGALAAKFDPDLGDTLFYGLYLSRRSGLDHGRRIERDLGFTGNVPRDPVIVNSREKQALRAAGPVQIGNLGFDPNFAQGAGETYSAEKADNRKESHLLHAHTHCRGGFRQLAPIDNRFSA